MSTDQPRRRLSCVGRAERREETERGAILVLVLLFLAGVGLIVGSLLTAAATAQTATESQNLAHADDYAVDAGVEYGIDRLATDDTNWCGTQSAGLQSQDITVNGANVHVTCNTVSGALDLLSNFALVSLDPTGNNGVTAQSGSSTADAIHVVGPTWIAGGIDLKSYMEIDRQCSGPGQPDPSCTAADGNGTLYQYSANCSGVTALRNSGGKTLISDTAGDPGNWQCTTFVPTVSPALPSPVPSLPTAPIQNALTNCTTLFPGHYTAPGTSPTASSSPLPALLQGVYLVSGDYYFDNIGVLDFGSKNPITLFGGEPSPTQSSVLSPAGYTPCDTDAKEHVTSAANGYGVQLVMGGNSQINTENKGAMELYTRFEPGSTQPLPSLRTVPSCPSSTSIDQPPCQAGWNPTNLPGGIGDYLLQSSGGSNVAVAIHGLVYSPNASVSLYGTNTSVGEILGGVVAWDLSLQKSASATSFELATSFTKTLRNTIITATVQYGGKPITATAYVAVGNGHPAKVTSWVVNNG